MLNLLSTAPTFFPRFYALQFLSQIMGARAALAQTYLLSAPPPGVDGVLTVLDPKAPAPGSQGPLGGGAGEMLRNEGLLLLPVLLAGNADLQKIIAFSGAFEKVLDVINSENGIEGGIVVQDALTVISTLLRFNVSNQVGQVETTTDSRICSASCLSSPLCLPFCTSQLAWLQTHLLQMSSPCRIGPSRKYTTLDWSWG